MLNRSFKPAKCKTALNLAKSRIKLMKNKKEIQMRQSKREVAQLLANTQDQTARIRVEHVVREEKTMAAYEMIEIYCELIVARLPIIESQKHCPLDLKEAITSLIFAAPRCGDIPELQDIRKHFSAKYGKDFVAAAVELRPECGVSRMLVEKLSVKAPDGPTKVKILKGIAEEHKIQWEPNWFKDEIPVSSGDALKVPQSEKSNMIQMDSLNVRIADDLEEKHTHDRARSKNSYSHAREDTDEATPSSPSRPNARPSGNISEGMLFSGSSGSAENAFPEASRQNWNMEFKVAASAARAAAESAERASMAARAAAELSIRSSSMSGRSSRPGFSSVHDQNETDRNYVGTVLPDKHVQEISMKSSLNQGSPRMKGGQGGAKEQDEMTKRHVRRSSNKFYAQSQEEYESPEELTDAECSSYHVNQDRRGQLRDTFTSPGTSQGDFNVFESSNSQDYESKFDENPFHEESVEMQNNTGSLHSQSSVLGDDDCLNHQSDKNDSDVGCTACNPVISEKDDWHVKTSHKSNPNDPFRDKNSRDDLKRQNFLESDEMKYGFDTDSGVFVNRSYETSGTRSDIIENVGQSGAGAVFDDSGSDNEECILDSKEEHGFASGNSLPKQSSIYEDHHPHFEPDLSESFRKSPIYSKLIEPLPVTFDDYEGPISESENELPTDKAEPESDSYDNRKSDSHSRITTRLSGLSFEEKGNSVESRDPVPKFDNDFDYSSEGRMELNLGSLPGGRRNRSNWRPPYTRGGLVEASSPSDASQAGLPDAFATSEGNSSTFKSQVSSRHTENNQVSSEMRRFNAFDDDFEVANIPKQSGSLERPYSGDPRKNMHKTRPQNPTGYFDADNSSSEEDFPGPEDIPRPVNSRAPVGTGFSRRTKGSAPITVARQQPADRSTKTGRASSSFAGTMDQSSLQDEETSRPRSETKAPKDYKSLSQLAAEENVTQTKTVEIQRASGSAEKAPSREISGKMPSHVHPKLPDSDTFAANFLSLMKSRQ